MNCSNCNQIVNGGKFCENCGAPLAVSEAAATQELPHSSTVSQQNKQLETAKKMSKLYLGYFLSVLKKPYVNASKLGHDQFINGLITMILYSLIIPFMFYLGIDRFSGLFSDSPFLDIVVKPTLGYAVFLLLIATYSFISIKLGQVNVDYKVVVARFGAFLVPFVAIFALAFIMSILKIDWYAILLLFGIIGSIFTVPPFVVSSFKKENPNGVDTVYGTLIVYVLTSITLVIMSKILLSMIGEIIENFIGSLLF
ncbi:zinc ribbon domain-containing protein [Bacillus thermocopriae]|jgi:hypothetical protein|uniref:Zinc ribbon domain-containing protein n=1 Tax=Neobacillus thermocopriae TaxID=1215031 RepID=A0A6B3TWB5_9BACI|nr:zinc ribbon domain-containing protein [Neobacillus thermocopriae]NEX80241.1 zinc ribbon domain-containing protein [Neobacillus thermocopriae]